MPEDHDTDPGLERAVVSLLPFVKQWGLSLNPEDLQLMASVVLEFSQSDQSDEAITERVEQILQVEREKRSRMHETWS
jgi:hypothetical protein